MIVKISNTRFAFNSKLGLYNLFEEGTKKTHFSYDDDECLHDVDFYFLGFAISVRMEHVVDWVRGFMQHIKYILTVVMYSSNKKKLWCW